MFRRMAWLRSTLLWVTNSTQWLQSAYDERAVWMEYLKVDPVLDSLRSQRRFQDLAKWASSIPEAALAEFD